ncbi:MAG: hypothetical protein PHU23_18840, partial [Dehalococcoidales bacterium]|nr:hypothetical protein [Dehalococcoidales bacterium]
MIKKKDVLEELLRCGGIDYINVLPQGRNDSKYGIALGQIMQDFKILRFCLESRPDMLVGSSASIARVGWLTRIPSTILSEDDAKEIKWFARTAYPFVDEILSPDVCDNGRWNSKTIKHPSYHEFAYLHP